MLTKSYLCKIGLADIDFLLEEGFDMNIASPKREFSMRGMENVWETIQDLAAHAGPDYAYAIGTHEEE